MVNNSFLTAGRPRSAIDDGRLRRTITAVIGLWIGRRPAGCARLGRERS